MTGFLVVVGDAMLRVIRQPAFLKECARVIHGSDVRDDDSCIELL